MAKYRKKPVVIEAFQMTQGRRWDNSEWPAWLHRAWNKGPEEEGGLLVDRNDSPRYEHLLIKTLEGVHRVEWGDWIIHGVKGELYACKPDIFEMSYEKVED